jgi:rod shape-determining protein MreC
MLALSTPRRNAAILVVMLALQLFLMSGAARRSGVALWIETRVMRLSAPAVILAQVSAGGVRRTIRGARDLLAAHARNSALETELQQLRAELVRYREAEPENRRLRRLLGMRSTMALRSVAASVITSNVNGKTRIVIVDRGRRDGVRVDLPVVTWGGAVGRVVAASASQAKIRLLNDASSGVAGVVQRSRAQGMVLGGAETALDMVYVPRYSDVMHGDRVVTSGLDGIFPRGFGIGRVNAISEEPDGTQTIHLEPELDYAALEEVLILLDRAAPDDEELDSAESLPEGS